LSEYFPAILSTNGQINVSLAGSILSSAAVGFAFGALLSSKISNHNRIVGLGSMFLYGICTISLLFKFQEIMMMIIAFSTTTIASAIVVSHLILIQKCCDEHMMGRIVGLESVLRRGFLAVGVLLMGILGDLQGMGRTAIAAVLIGLAVKSAFSFIR